jgi:hypothetical protein
MALALAVPWPPLWRLIGGLSALGLVAVVAHLNRLILRLASTGHGPASGGRWLGSMLPVLAAASELAGLALLRDQWAG